jgi:hypothetical protein
LTDFSAGKEAVRRLFFELDSITQEMSTHATEGNVEYLEALGEKKVELAQECQKMVCGLLGEQEELGFQRTFVDEPMESFRKEWNGFVKKISDIKDQLIGAYIPRSSACLQNLILAHEEQRSCFAKRSLELGSTLSYSTEEFHSIEKLETQAVENVSQLLAQLDHLRARKLICAQKLLSTAQAKKELYRAHHCASLGWHVEYNTAEALQEMSLQCVAVISLLLQWAERVKEREHSEIMAVQRRLFEMQTAVHHWHVSAYRHLAISANELTWRREQAHSLICERLDRCNVEMELAADAFDPTARSIARERDELAKLSSEMLRGIETVRSISHFSADVFAKKTANLFIEARRDFEDPREELKRIELNRKLKLKAITDQLKAGDGHRV